MQFLHISGNVWVSELESGVSGGKKCKKIQFFAIFGQKTRLWGPGKGWFWAGNGVSEGKNAKKMQFLHTSGNIGVFVPEW